MNQSNLKDALSKLESAPRLKVGFYPTPIEELTRFREAIGGGPRLLIKRDDYTGAGMGGNKVRKLEYVLAQSIIDGAEAAITVGSEKSNHARVTASLCARMGLRCLLVLNRPSQGRDVLKPASLRVEEMMGAEVHFVDDRTDRMPMMRAIAERLRSEGVRAVEIPIGASTALGSLGYVRAAGEAADQLRTMNVKPDYIFHSSSSGGTQAGLITGCHLFGLNDTRIVGVSPDDPASSIAGEVSRIVASLDQMLDLDGGKLLEDVMVTDEYIGDGYGISSPESESALNLLARNEGTLLDPVYTAKAMAALIDWIKQGRLTEKDTVLFWHTGGQLAMFYSPPA